MAPLHGKQALESVHSVGSSVYKDLKKEREVWQSQASTSNPTEGFDGFRRVLTNLRSNQEPT